MQTLDSRHTDGIGILVFLWVLEGLPGTAWAVPGGVSHKELGPCYSSAVSWTCPRFWPQAPLCQFAFLILLSCSVRPHHTARSVGEGSVCCSHLPSSQFLLPLDEKRHWPCVTSVSPLGTKHPPGTAETGRRLRGEDGARLPLVTQAG